MLKLTFDAFLATSQGYSEDRVLCDPDLNTHYLMECRRLGSLEPDVLLNRSLLSLRKSGRMSGKRKSKPTHFANEDEYRFAAEMAIRFLERRDSTTLDNVLCDPVIVSKFDALAARLAPGFTSLQYRWAALNLRKSKRLQPEIASRVAPPIEVLRWNVGEMSMDLVPNKQGLYLFFDGKSLLYVGEAEDLRRRIKKHLDHSDNKGLARWMWDQGTQELVLEIQVLDSGTTTRTRKALELELIRSRDPLFNIKR